MTPRPRSSYTSRVKQPRGERGSLRFIQQLVEYQPTLLDDQLRAAGALSAGAAVEWVSPRRADDWAEYRDAGFLDRLGLSALAPELRRFWPKRGPQWDALGRAGDAVFLVEAKAHVAEMQSSCSASASPSIDAIDAALKVTKDRLGVHAGGDWKTGYYQLANRLAHLLFLQHAGVDATLVLLGFTGKTEMPSPATPAAYEAAYAAAWQHLGLDRRLLPPGIVHVYLDVSELADGPRSP